MKGWAVTMMNDTFTTAAILEVFTREINDRGGRVTDTFHDGGRLFIRSLLPNVAEVRPKDRMEGGIALRSNEEELWLHPYLFRQVCRNGAITAQSIESLHVECLGAYTLEEGTSMLREAIARCAEKRVFAKSIRRLRTAALSEVDELLNLMAHVSELQRAGMGSFLGQILGRFVGEGDRSRFGFMNAVTSVARDTRDPDDRWRLEELGGGIGARLRPKRPSNAPGQDISSRERELVPSI
jgi:hypothetical protein